MKSDLLRPVDARFIIIGIFDPFYPLSPSQYFIPLGAFYYCWEEQTLLKFGVFQTPLRSCMFVQFRSIRSLSGRTFFYVQFRLQQCECFIIICWSESWLVTWGFSVILPKICIKPSIPEVNILWCKTLWSVLHKICPIWGYCAFPHEWNCEKFIIKHHTKLMWDMKSCWV